MCSDLLVRTPVVEDLKSRKLANLRQGQNVLGVDPGLASTGASVINRAEPGAPYIALGVELISTKRSDRLSREKVRVTTDDQRRFKEILDRLAVLASELNPYAVGIECYVVNLFKKRIGKAMPQPAVNVQSIKTYGVYTSVLGWAHGAGMVAEGFLPTDLKRRFCGKTKASKDDVAQALYAQVAGLEEMVLRYKKDVREHLTDAAGHAILMFEYSDEIRKMIGVC